MAIRHFLLTVFLSAMAVATAHAWPPEIGEQPKPLNKLEYLDGSQIDLNDLKGHPVVLYFGADWCQPCVQRGRPTTEAVSKKYGPSGLKTIFVSMDDNKFRPQKKIEAQSLGMPIAMAKLDICPPGECPDGLRNLGEFGRIYRYPTAIVLDANGIIRHKMDSGQGVLHNLENSVRQVMGQ